MPGTVITERVREKFKRFSETGRVFFMGAACGFGKSTVAEELLSGKRVKRISFPEGDISSVTTGGWDFFLADGLHTIQDRSVSDALVALIRENPGKKFVILSRGQVPGYLMPFSYSGIMETVGPGTCFLTGRRRRSSCQRAAGYSPRRTFPHSIRSRWAALWRL